MQSHFSYGVGNPTSVKCLGGTFEHGVEILFVCLFGWLVMSNLFGNHCAEGLGHERYVALLGVDFG